MAERQEALREFVAVTGTEDDRARFFLESAGWDLQVGPRGRLRRAGRELRGAGVWHVQSVVAEAHSHPPRAAARHRPWGPAAACQALPAQLGREKTRGGPAPDLPSLASVSPPASPVRWASEMWALQLPAWVGGPGAWRPRGFSAGGRAARPAPRGAALGPRWSFPFATPAGGRSPA